ncbi:MAG: aldehyde ferredoxin oxidoreductase family protein [Deltaproteobacteria bacterium]|nr:aldehyde ferredoxin oxidoreductase family protein [Deltaproteobacteria bacterium]
MKGYQGKCLVVDLSRGTVKESPLNMEDARRFVGGRGLATKMLFDMIDPRVEPLGPENVLIMMTGPLTASGAPSACRYMVVTKSPLTGLVASSNSGGFFPAELKRAGFDGIVFKGKSPEPVYLYVHEGRAELRDATHLWGKTVSQTEEALAQELGEARVRVACIGPGGERLSRISGVMNDRYRAAGRSGVGAVMGSKNLKAVVARGTSDVPIGDPGGFRAAVKAAREKIRTSPTTSELFPELGTAVLVNPMNNLGMFPTLNFREATFDAAEKISAETMKGTIVKRKKACYGCTIACTRWSEVDDPKYACKGEGPEYETVWALGALCGVDNLHAVAKANCLCNDLGLDTMSVGGTIACAMEMAEDGVIPEAGIGFKLGFGDADAMVKLTEMIGYREGFGDVLAEGSYLLAVKYGRPEYFQGVKRQEPAGYDPRASQGMGLAYATSNRGACHVRAFMIGVEVFGAPVKLEPSATAEKAHWLKIFQDTSAFTDALGFCNFVLQAFGGEEMAEMFSRTTGESFGWDDLLKVGERIWNLERLFNIRAGMNPADDVLPLRQMTPEGAIPRGPTRGQYNRLGEMLPEYYQERGWDSSGMPTPEKLAELGIEL